MPPAARKNCDFPGCIAGPTDEDGTRTQYITPEGLATRAEVTADLLQHVEMAHILPIKLLEAQRDATQAEANKATAEAAKIREERGPGEQLPQANPVTVQRDSKPKVESIPRPTIDEGVTESDWSFFTNQWDRYVQGTGLTGVQRAPPHSKSPFTTAEPGR